MIFLILNTCLADAESYRCSKEKISVDKIFRFINPLTNVYTEIHLLLSSETHLVLKNSQLRGKACQTKLISFSLQSDSKTSLK